MTDSFGDVIGDAIKDAMRDMHQALDDAGLAESEVDAEPGRPIEREFSVGTGAELYVSNVSGQIDVRGGAPGTIQVVATPRGSRSGGTPQVSFSHEGNRVTVTARGATGGLFHSARTARVDYRISVPHDCAVFVHTVSGEVDVQDVNAAATVESVSGDIELRHVGGDLTITTVSGDLQVSEAQASLVLRTTSGDARIDGSAIRRFNLNTVSGDFIIETPLLPGEHYLAKTVSGDVQLRVPPSTGATVQLKTTSGDLICSLPAEIIKSGRRQWQGRINGGGASVEMQSVSGDLQIEAGRDADSPTPQNRYEVLPPQPAEVAPAEPAASLVEDPVPNETTASVLGQLERGEISVEEAMARLDQLNG